MGQRQGHGSLLRDRRVAARSRQALRVSRTAWIGPRTQPAPRTISWWAIRWIATRSSMRSPRGRTDRGMRLTMRRSKSAQLQLIWGTVAAVECEVVQALAAVANSCRQLQSSERVQQRRAAPGYKDNRPSISSYQFQGASREVRMERRLRIAVWCWRGRAESHLIRRRTLDGQLFLKRGGKLPECWWPCDPLEVPRRRRHHHLRPRMRLTTTSRADTQGWQGTAPVVSVARSTAEWFAGRQLQRNQRIRQSRLRERRRNRGEGKRDGDVPRVPAGGCPDYLHTALCAARSCGWLALETGNWQPISALRAGAWNTLTVQVPADAASSSSLGVQFTTNGAFNVPCISTA